MVSAPALLRRWRHSFSPGTANLNVHAVTAWKISSLQHVLVASCCESQCSKPIPAYMRAACPKVEGREEKREKKNPNSPALPSREHDQQVRCCAILSQAESSTQGNPQIFARAAAWQQREAAKWWVVGVRAGRGETQNAYLC